jgi:hypothetical protein
MEKSNGSDRLFCVKATPEANSTAKSTTISVLQVRSIFSPLPHFYSSLAPQKLAQR